MIASHKWVMQIGLHTEIANTQISPEVVYVALYFRYPLKNKNKALPKIAMRSRDTLLDLFSTFAFLEGDRVRQWIAEPRLRRSMQKCITDSNSPGSGAAGGLEQAWTLYWYKIWQSQQSSEAKPSEAKPSEQRPSIAEQHLTAYLQEACYWTAQKTVQRFSQLEYTLSDYFQIISSETKRVLKGYNPNFGTHLKGYAPIVLTNILKDYLRQRRAIDVCSDWAMLRKVSQKRVNEVLQNAGVLPEEAEQYSFIWVCFKTISVPANNPLTADSASAELEKTIEPNADLWSNVAALYNAKRNQQLSQATPALTPTQIEARMTKLTRWIREYLYPAIDSLNKIKAGQEQGEIQDDLSDPMANNSLLDAAIEAETSQERQQQRSQLQAALTQSLGELDETAAKILRLFYQENLSQQELAARMEMSQPTVSRRLKKAEETLLTNLLAIVKDSHDNSVNNSSNPVELKHISLLLKEWLGTYYRREASASLIS
jgi:RNA polymerase sigma factor (sigma-70 family)